MTEYIFLFFSALLAFVVKGITGFGNTLVMGSLFSFAVPNRQTTPIDLMISLPTNGYMAWRERKSISPKVVLPLSLMMIAGIIPGTFLLQIGSDWILKSAFGILTIGMAIEIWLRKSAKKGKATNKIALLVIGVLSGVLAGVFGIGALLVSYISRTSDNRNKFRADICCVFLVENVFRFVLYFATGIINKGIVTTTLALLPAVVIGLFVGFKIDARIKEETVTKIVILLLLASGATLFIKSAFFH